jgi:Ca-activated chloride channel family protein
MSFGAMWMAWIAGVSAVLLSIVYSLDITRRRRTIERVGYEPMLRRMTGSLSLRRRIFKATFMIGAVVLLIVSLARPQVRGESTWRQRGIDVAVVMDFSKSMLARDVYPSRFERMTREVDDLIDGLDADRVSTVVFGGAASHFPLTHDHSSAKLLYLGLHPRDVAPGSNLSEGFRVARCAMGKSDDFDCERVGQDGRGWGICNAEPEAVPSARIPQESERTRVIVIFTDGEDTEGSAKAEVEAAVEQGIEVFVVGVGTLAGELIPEFNEDGQPIGSKKADDGSLITTKLNQSALRELAAISGKPNRYFIIDDAGFRSDALLDELKKLKKGDLDQRIVYKYREVYPWFLFPAFMLLLIEACVSDRHRRARRQEEA